jgi:hypothetical protein
MIRYHGSDTPVLVGDHVELRDPLFFRRRWRSGRVVFVPGLSPPAPELEFGHADWVVVREAQGGRTGVVVDPRSKVLRPTVRFVRRSDDELRTTPADIPLPG